MKPGELQKPAQHLLNITNGVSCMLCVCTYSQPLRLKLSIILVKVQGISEQAQVMVVLDIMGKQIEGTVVAA